MKSEQAELTFLRAIAGLMATGHMQHWFITVSKDDACMYVIQGVLLDRMPGFICCNLILSLLYQAVSTTYNEPKCYR